MKGRQRTGSRLLLGIFTVTLLACDGDTPSGPSSTNPLAGSWSGTVTDFSLGTGRVEMVLTGDANETRGSWSVTVGTRTYRGTLAEQPTPGVSKTTTTIRIACTSSGNGGGTIQRRGNELFLTYLLDDCGSLGTGTMTLTAR